MQEKEIDAEIKNSLVSLERMYLAEKLKELTIRHIEMTLEYNRLHTETSADSIKKEHCLKEILEIKMQELWTLRNELDEMREQDRRRQQIYKKNKNLSKMDLLIKLLT